MSSLTRCNYCNLREHRKHAAETNRRVVLKTSPLDEDHPTIFADGKNVYLVPKGEKLIRETEEQCWAAWMAEIPDHCVC